MGQPRGGVTHEPAFVFLEKEDSTTEFSLSTYFLLMKNVSFQRGALCWTWGPLCMRGCPSFCIPSGCSQPGVSTLTWGWRGSGQRPLKAATPQGYLWWIYSQPGDIETRRNLPFVEKPVPEGQSRASSPPHLARRRVVLGFGGHQRAPQTPEASKQCFQAEFEGLQEDVCLQLAVCWSAGIHVSGTAVGCCHGGKVPQRPFTAPFKCLS